MGALSSPALIKQGSPPMGYRILGAIVVWGFALYGFKTWYTTHVDKKDDGNE